MSCSDPLRDREIADLGDEAPGVPAGPLHRPGQPCVVCHSDGGPASGSPFAVAGTVFETSSPASMGASNVRVFFLDASNAQRDVVTNDAGNFFLTQTDWPDLAYPLKAGILRNGMPVSMRSIINREPSCNFCHRPSPGSRLSVPGDDPRASVGQIYVTVGGGS